MELYFTSWADMTIGANTQTGSFTALTYNSVNILTSCAASAPPTVASIQTSTTGATVTWNAYTGRSTATRYYVTYVDISSQTQGPSFTLSLPATLSYSLNITGGNIGDSYVVYVIPATGTQNMTAAVSNPFTLVAAGSSVSCVMTAVMPNMTAGPAFGGLMTATFTYDSSHLIASPVNGYGQGFLVTSLTGSRTIWQSD